MAVYMRAKNSSKDNYRGEVVCGFHAVGALLDTDHKKIQEILLNAKRSDARMQMIARALKDKKIRPRRCSKEELDAIAGAVKHQGIIAIIGANKNKPRDFTEYLDNLNSPILLLLLDCIQDPRNLGACLRSAAAAGVDAVVLPKDRACPINASVRRSAAGAVERLNIFYVVNLARAMGEIKARGIWITGADADAEQSIYEIDFKANTAIVMGGEGRGLRKLTQDNCDQIARIPMPGGIASLNVSVATSLFLYEAVRQRS